MSSQPIIPSVAKPHARASGIVVPAQSNHQLADLVRARVTFRMLSFVAHAKAVVIDDDLALCG